MKAINTTIFKTAFILLVLGVFVKGHPVEVDVESSKPPAEDTGDHYDQRQNGTENYRIHVDGLVLVVAPAETLLLAGGLAGTGEPDLFALGQDGLLDSSKPGAGAASKPKPEVEDVPKPVKQKSAHGSSLRLVNLIAPMLRRVQQ